MLAVYVWLTVASWGTELDYVLVPPQPVEASARVDGTSAAAPVVLYLDRCAGGCVITKGDDNAATDSSSVIVSGGTLSANPATTTEWAELVACVRDTYAPYNVSVVDSAPSDRHVEVKVAGAPAQLGLSNQVLGIAPLTTNCSRQTNSIGFAFTSNHGSIEELCATVAHEAGHIFGLDHAFDCRDPMTYLTGCTPRKRFLHVAQPCGEFNSERACRCGATQDSHDVLRETLGAGTMPPAPLTMVSYPVPATTLGGTSSVIGASETERTLVRSEAWIGGRRSSEMVAARGTTAFLHNSLPIPSAAFDIVVREWDDLGGMGEGVQTIRAERQCQSAADCGGPWACTSGKCVFAPGTAELGESCVNNDSCATQFCANDGSTSICVERCVVGEAACPSGYECLAIESPALGACWPAPDSGCCGASNPASALWAAPLLALLRRRHKRRP